MLILTTKGKPMDRNLLFDVYIYKNELNSRDCCNSDLEVCNLQKNCIKIFKFNDNWNIEGYNPNENSFGEKDTKEYGVPSKHSITDFFWE